MGTDSKVLRLGCFTHSLVVCARRFWGGEGFVLSHEVFMVDYFYTHREECFPPQLQQVDGGRYYEGI